MACSVGDAAKLNVLWKKHASFKTDKLSAGRLHEIIRREVKAAKRLVQQGMISRALLTELRNDLRTVGSIKKRCK